MKNFRSLLPAILFLFLSACATPTIPPTSKQMNDISRYSFVVLENSAPINSLSVYEGSVKTKRLNPSELIEGLLLRRNLVRVNSAAESPSRTKTLVVRWGVSGRRDVLLGLRGYTQEVTMALLDATNMEPVYSCSAEGIGATEADDIREAITACLKQLK